MQCPEPSASRNGAIRYIAPLSYTAQILLPERIRMKPLKVKDDNKLTGTIAEVHKTLPRTTLAGSTLRWDRLFPSPGLVVLRYKQR